MERDTMRASVMVCVLAMSACSGTPQTMLSPSGVAPSVTFVNPDGSTLKVTAPRDLGPAGVTVGTLRPTLTFTNPTARYATVGFAYDVEVLSANGTVMYARTIGESPGSGSHTLDADLNYSENYSWRVRARLGTQVGPFADATFRTMDRPAPPTPPTVTPPVGGGLPFAIPAECGPGGPTNRLPCVAAVAARSAEWGRCASGVGIGCHRFARQVVYALSRSDPNFKMIVAAPGGNACNCSACGPSDGTMFREDTTVYGGNQVFDMIGGAGGPTPSIGWSGVGPPRPGDLPNDAPLCVP